jgi:Protein of unknown function (DUF2938)
MSDFLIRSIIMGVAATALLDIWALLLKAVFGFATPNWAMSGRWFGHVLKGHFKHESIADAPAFENELAMGWIGHYVIGILFAAATLLIGGAAWVKLPTWPIPIAIGLITVGCGWFIMQPGMGNGMAASKRPDASRIRILNILGHIIFGLGLLVSAILIRGI